MRPYVFLPLLAALCLTLLASPPLEAFRDPGVLLRVDRARFELSASDLATRSSGPRFSVALGSPTNPTPPGTFRPLRAVRNPSWTPGVTARALGAEPLPPSSDGPLGVGKIPLEDGGTQIHGGAHPLELGKPVSLGCIRLLDSEWDDLVTWLGEQETLTPWTREEDGESVSRFQRPVTVVVE